MNTLKILVVFVFISLTSFAQVNFKKEAKWIWYPGDFEVWLHTQVGGLMEERGQPLPPFWRVDSHYGIVTFEKKYDFPKPQKIQIFAEGRYYMDIDWVIMNSFDPLNY